ncbi:MAG: Gfo/Idh/MocA family oxidoreductase [Chloroflexi bacterium]|nr:Gfo/Idh/MocA family oxidoreductase [Chloroflexota bacterium]
MMLRAGVVGVGTIGKQHARIYNDLDGVELVAVADPLADRAQAVADRYKIPGYADHLALFDHERLDLVSVSVPTVLHASVASVALSRGIHVLIEKPIAATRADAEQLIAQAQAANLVLTVGHVERFNPAVIEVKKQLDAGALGEVFQVQARRLSPFPQYVRDVGVVMDLATHELDILRYILASEPESIFARTSRRLHAEHEDAVFAILNFASGPIAMLDINWLTPTKLRELRITGQKGMFLIDYISQDLYFYENSYRPSEWDTLALFRGIEEGNVTKIRLAKTEPLRAELASFVDAVRTHQSPVVTGADGLQALLLAQTLIQSGAEGRVIRLTPYPPPPSPPPFPLSICHVLKDVANGEGEGGRGDRG